MSVIQLGQMTVGLISTLLGFVVLRGRRENIVNRAFAAQCLIFAGWVLGLSGLHTPDTVHQSFALAFAFASLIPVGVFIFNYAYANPLSAIPAYVRAILAVGSLFSLLSVTTDLILFDAKLSHGEVTRQTGVLYPAFAAYFIVTLSAALWIVIKKWRSSHGADRARYRHLGAGLIGGSIGAISTNLLIPLLTGHSTYSWIGPYFTLVYVGFVAHAIIRHRLMDLRLFIHRGLTIGLATVFSSIPVCILLAMFWPRLLTSFHSSELVLLVMMVGLVTVLIPVTRDVASRLLDRYVYRTQANYQRTVREASRVLTRVLHLEKLLAFIATTVVGSTGASGAAIYLRENGILRRALVESHSEVGSFDPPPLVSLGVIAALEAAQGPILTEEVSRGCERNAGAAHAELLRNEWALVLPVFSEDALIAIIAVGSKLSGDSFYQQDLDLLMTLANQAGIAVKNARLYTAVVVANEYLENIVAALDTGVIAVNSSGQIAIFNKAAEELTGLSAQTAKAEGTKALPACLANPLLATVRDGEPRVQPEVELVPTLSNDNAPLARPVICTTSPVRDPAGVVLGAVTVFSDLTPLKQLETERRSAERLVYFQTLAAGIAHEIKNPLVAIKTFTQLLPRRYGDSRFIDEFGRISQREIDRMQRIVDRLSALSRPTDGPRAPIDVRSPLGEAIEFIQPTLGEKSLSLSLSLTEEPCVIVGNAGELEQIFLNLFLNAYDATPSGGQVTVEAIRTDAEVLITIADSGTGIPPEILDKIFEPFFTTKTRGSGLGLAVSDGIARAHGGHIRAMNHPTGGAMFIAAFPIATAASATLA